MGAVRKLTAPIVVVVSALLLTSLTIGAWWIWIRDPDLGPPGSNPAVVAAPTPSTDGLRLPKKRGSVRFAVIGDMGRGDQNQIDTANQMARWLGKFDYSFVLMLGDNLYSNGSGAPEEYYNRFEQPYKALLDKGITFYAAAGNHDPANIYDYKPFNMDGNRYYSFKKDGAVPIGEEKAEFFAIDTNRLDAAQLRWIPDRLAASKADWKIAFYHHPIYSSGRYAFQASRLRRTLEPLFVQGGLDVALSGHEHLYERSHPQNGVVYFTSGAGGALRKGDLTATATTAAGFDQDTHFLLMEISGDTLYFQAISRIGDTVDSGQFERVEHKPAPASPRK